MKIKLLTVGKFSEPCYGQMAGQYQKRISRSYPIELVSIRAEKLASLSAKEALLRESKRILEEMNRMDYTVALDSRGRMLDSLELADWLNKRSLSGIKSLMLIIGGPHGLHKSVSQTAQEQLSLSRLTLAHELAAVVFLEQLYRACSILRGEKYHK